MVNNQIVGRSLLILFLITSSILSLTLIPIIAIVYLALFLSLVALNLQATLFSNEFINSFPLILFATLPISIINFFAYGEYRYFLYACFLPIGFLVGLLLRKDPALLRKTLFASIIILQALLFVQLIINGFSPGYSYEQIIEGVSSNGFTTILVLILSFYLINTIHWSFCDFIISAFSLYLCIYGYGRGSIVACILVLFAFAIQILRMSRLQLIFKIRITKRLLLLALCCVILIFTILSVDFFLLVETYTKFRVYSGSDTGIFSSLRDPSREAALLNYWNNLDIFSLIFGNDSPYLYFHKNLNGNPHNAFLNSHRLFGVFYISATIFLAFKLNARSNLSPLPPEKYLLIIVVFLRILSEPFLFGSPLDVILFSTMATNPKKTFTQNSFLDSKVS